MRIFRIFILFSIFMAKPLFLAAESPVFFDSYLIVPERYAGEFEDLADPNLRYVPSSRAYLVPYDSLAALTSKQLFIIFFEIPQDRWSNGDRLALSRQFQAVRAFLRLPFSRMAELLTHRDLKLSAHFEDARVEGSKASIAKYYALQLLAHREKIFLNALAYLAANPFDPDPIQKAWYLLELIREERQSIPGRGLSLSEILELVEKMPIKSEIRSGSNSEWREMARDFLERKLKLSMGLSQERVSKEEISKFKDLAFREYITPESSNESSLSEAGSLQQAIRLSDGEYIVLNNDDSRLLQIIPSSGTPVILVLRSNTHTIAMVMDPAIHPEDALFRIFERVKLIKVRTSGMKASIFGGSRGVSSRLVYRIKRWLSSNGKGNRVDEEASEYLSSRRAFGVALSDKLSLISSRESRSLPLIRRPDEVELLLQTHPASMDAGDLFGKPRIPLPKNGSLSAYDQNGDQMIGREDLMQLNFVDLRKLFNPSEEDIHEFPKDEAASLILDLPYWVVAEVFSQKFTDKQKDLLRLYVDSLRSYDSQKLEQVILYLAPQSDRFDSLARQRVLSSILESIDLEEREEFLNRLSQNGNSAFKNYVDALIKSFIHSQETEGEPIESSSDSTKTDEAFVVKESQSVAEASASEEDSLELRLEDIDEMEARPDFSYIPNVATGSWSYSPKPLKEPQRAALKFMIETDGIVVSVRDPSKNLIAVVHLKADVSRMETHKLIDKFFDSLLEAQFNLEDSQVQVLVGNQASVQSSGSRSTLDRIQKRFLLYGFRSVDSVDLGIDPKEEWAPVLLEFSEDKIYRLRKARLFELRSALRIERSPAVNTKSFVSLKDVSLKNESLYRYGVRGRCEKALARFAESRQKINEGIRSQF